jgi:hypothetical protein
MMEDTKRGPGRPKADTLKKGVKSWTPAAVTDVTNKEAGYRYRWVNKDPDNLAKKKAEHWEYVDSATDSANAPAPRMEDGSPMTSVVDKRDVVLMRIPEEFAQGRDAYMNNKADSRIAAVTKQTKADLAKEGAEMHGDITISTRRG